MNNFDDILDVKAETPAEPMRGLTLPFVNLHMILPPIKPPIVESIKAQSPRIMINTVSSFRNISALAVAPTEIPRKMVTTLMSPFCAV